MQADDVNTLDDLLNYIERHAASIFVREEVNGKWDAYSLADLPGSLAVKHAFRFIREGVVPVRVLTDEEVAAKRSTSAGPL